MPLTFPNPVYPSDVAVEALDGTTHQRTGLFHVPKGAGPTSSPTLEVQVNRNLDRLHELVTEANGLRAVSEGALLIGVYPGFYTLGGASKEFQGATGQSLTDNAVNWVWIDAANALAVSTANFPVDLDTFVPVAKVTTASGAITEIEDRRGAARIVVGGASATMGTDATSFTIDQNNTGAGVTTDVRFNRGTTDDDAAAVWDGTNTPWSGDEANKLYLQSGQHTSTLKTSQAVGGVDTSPQDISWDGVNTPWTGSAASKLYLQSGQYTSTLKTSQSVGSVDFSCRGISWDGTNTPWCGESGDKLYLQSGQYTSTLKTSQAQVSIDDRVMGIDTDDVNSRLTPSGAGQPFRLRGMMIPGWAGGRVGRVA